MCAVHPHQRLHIVKIKIVCILAVVMELPTVSYTIQMVVVIQQAVAKAPLENLIN